MKPQRPGPTVTAMYRSGRPVRGAVDFHATIERALAQERGSALGRAGRRLDEAILTHRLLTEVGSATVEQMGAALGEVTQSAWALMVQREYVGFRSDNLAWLRPTTPFLRRCFGDCDVGLRRVPAATRQ